MAMGDVDFGAVLRRLAERRIEDAMAEGKFDHLPGAGQPLELEPMPAEENARAAWWALRIMRQNNVIPEEVRWRKQAADLRRRAEAATGADRRKLVEAHNALVRRVNTLGTNALKIPLDALPEDD